MAQYLAKSQYDNQMVYIMNNEQDDGVSFDYESTNGDCLFNTHTRRTAGPYRRGLKID